MKNVTVAKRSCFIRNLGRYHATRQKANNAESTSNKLSLLYRNYCEMSHNTKLRCSVLGQGLLQLSLPQASNLPLLSCKIVRINLTNSKQNFVA